MNYKDIFKPETLAKLDKQSADNLRKMMGNKSLMDKLVRSQELLSEINEAEKPYRDLLEALAIDMVKQMYPIIDEENINIDAKIVDISQVGQELDEIKINNPIVKSPIKIIRSWNPPPKEHWLVRNYFDIEQTEVDDYYRLKPKDIKGHLALFGDYTINKSNIDPNTQARYERYKETFPRYYYTQIKGYVSSGGDRRVYYNWQKIPYAKFLEIDAPMVYGVDFGDTAKTSLTAVKYKDGNFYRHEILYKSLRELQVLYGDKINHIKEKLSHIKDNDQNNIWTKHKGLLTYVFELLNIDKNIDMFCDPAQKSLITELRHAGYRSVMAKKEKEDNINFINRAGNYYTDTSYNLEAEYSVYYLDEDINKNPIDGKPKAGQQDHAMHSQEYGCRGLKDKLGITL